MDHFYITTPIYYVNAKPHLGHAYTTIVADSMARFHRLLGEDCFFLTGTDEHGDKIVQAAEKSKQSPQEYVDAISQLFQELWPRLQIDHSDFIRTTDTFHKKCVQDILQKVYDSGDIYFGEYGGHYCYGCERFLTEKELEDGLCPDHKTKPEHILEKNYFFKMSKYQDWLVEHIQNNPDFIRPDQYKKEVLSLLQSGELEDLCISRPKSRLTWGVELPFDKDFVCYVWFDALLNYVSALGYPDGERYKTYWPKANHLIAKDILKPHAVFWPTMLRAAGLPVYNHLNVHGYWLVKDTKMSKSLGNVVEPLDMAEKYGLSAFRYFLLREMQFGHDASFSEQGLVARFNADLANDLGNLLSRSLSMSKKYLGGVVPENISGQLKETKDIQALAKQSMLGFQSMFLSSQFSRGLESLWELVRGLNKYIDSCAPWALHKQGENEKVQEVLYTVLEMLRKISLHLWCVMPEAAEVMLKQLGCGFSASDVNLASEVESWGGLKPGVQLASKSNIFPRVDVAQEEHKETVPSEEKESTAMIEFPDFQKIDLRVGTIIEAKAHPKADRLLQVQVDLGKEKRQIIAGIADFYTPEDLIGKQVTVVANLKPRKLRGLESQGMILAVRSGEHLTLLSPLDSVSPGSEVS